MIGEAAAVAQDVDAFGYLDAGAKREIRRACLKAIAIPGHQVPYASRDLPIARGFGTGGLQISLSLLGGGDVIKVIDQGADDSVNAVALRGFFTRVCPGLTATTRTQDATLIQTRHRIPERPLRADQILVLQVPYPDPLVIVEADATTRRRQHATADYNRLWTALYEDAARHGAVTISHRYPVRIHVHYVIDPSPIPRWDVPKLHQSQCLHLFGAGRERRIYAVPPHTHAEPLSFSDIPFAVEDFTNDAGVRHRCERCGCTNSFLDAVIDTHGETRWRCSDADHCAQTIEAAP